MKKFTIALVATLTLGFTALTAGGDIAPVEAPVQVVKANKFYVGGNVGVSGINVSDSKYDINSQTSLIGLDAGYQLLPYLAIEGRYGFSLNDTFQDIGVDNDRNYWGIYAKPSYEVMDVKLYALVGYGKINNKEGFSGGLGLAYPIAGNVEVFADYVYFDSNSDFGKVFIEDAGVASVGLNYKF